MAGGNVRGPLQLRWCPVAVAVWCVACLETWASYPAPDELTEHAAADWAAEAVSASAAIFDDNARVAVGAWSIRLETDAPFDCRMWTPAARNADWDISTVARLRFRVYAVNPNLGFQNNSPWVILGSDAGQWEFRPTYELLNEARNNWLHIDIPLSGNRVWQRTSTGSFDPTHVRFVEIHADTWDAGFTLWIDGLTFDPTPPPPDGLGAVALNNLVRLRWLPYSAPPGFDHFAVYRRTEPFSSVAGLTPLATIPNAAATTFDDAAAVNGTSYHYAVTAVATGGAEETDVDSLGPRTPRSETDAQIVCIERTPRYPRYDPIYTGYTITEPSGYGPYFFTAATGLGSGQTGGTQRFPGVGETVTYTARIRNRGTNTIAGPLDVTWRYDGGVIAQQVVPGPLAPGGVASTDVPRTWDGQSHALSATLDLIDDRPGNNVLAIDTRGVGFLTFVDEGHVEDFRERTPQYPQAATDDIIDWLNRHMDEFNRLFNESGSRKRVRFDRLEVVPDHSPDPPVNTIEFAVFPLRLYAGQGDLRLSGYYHAGADIDYGLLHEQGHQLGLIDLYRLDLPAAKNLVSGRGYTTIPCLMHGVSTLISPHSALAMEHWYDVAHGYFGQYLYAMPQTIAVRFFGVRGLPLAGADVRMYQKLEVPGQGEIIPNQVKAAGVTDANGVWVLPNVPIDPGLVPRTFAGDELRPNPFGYVAVVGTNGLLHFRVEKDDAVDYAWLDITEVNVAYWQGQTTEATFERRLAIGGPLQPVPPPELTELNAADWFAYADGSTPQSTYVEDETSPGMHPVGEGSLRFVTDGGGDTFVRYPATYNARWDLSGVQSILVRFRSENPNLGFQNASPWIRLGDNQNNYYEYQYYVGGNPVDLLNETIGQWRSYAVPIDAPANPGTGWGRRTVGSPNLAAVRQIEIHADTWGAGFVLWIDGLSFDPPPCLSGDLNGDGQRDGLDVAEFVEAMLTGASPFALCAGDFNGNGVLDPPDIAGFVACLLSLASCP